MQVDCVRCGSQMEERWEDERKLYYCKSCHFTCCEHLGEHPRTFSCIECDSPVEECDCYDCDVFCSKCNHPIFGCSCSDVREAWRRKSAAHS